MELILKQNTNKSYLININEKMKAKVSKVKEREPTHYFEELQKYGFEDKVE